MSEVPLNTEELVEFDAYLKTSSEVTAYKLRQEVTEAAHRLEFLMNYADLSRMFQFQNIKVSIWKYLYIDIGLCMHKCSSSRMLMESSKRDRKEIKRI